MRVNDLYPEESLSEDFKSAMRGVGLGAALIAAPFVYNQFGKDQTEIVQERPLSEDELVLAQTMWGEARSHGEDGMRAVGHVIYNRATHSNKKLFGDGVIGAAKKKWQFSCWNPNDVNSKKIAEITELDHAVVADSNITLSAKQKLERAAFQKAKQIAREILSNQSNDPTDGALFYHTTAVSPPWAKKMDPIGQVENHIFYRGIRK